MFGLNEISWKEFIQFLGLLLLLWYTVLLLWSWYKSQKKQNGLFEDDRVAGDTVMTGVQPVVVSASNFPSKLISSISENSIPLEVSVYEETGVNDGIHIDYFLNELTGKLEKLLPEIQYQQ
ncbi:hypothetical protein [Draconibacterium orientale]|uniref:hypothetical protein n=1 Tax=Draconibacterium orientale TaxID=1168034 RepID=UPI002A0A9B65|nr:hypothetical protein [Draconibacterium orientale]